MTREERRQVHSDPIISSVILTFLDVGRGISHVSVFGGPWFFGIMIRRGEILISRVIYAIIIIHNFASVGQHLGGSKRGIVHVTGHTSLSANCRSSMHTTDGIVNCHVG